MNVRSLHGRKLRVASFVAAGVIGFGTVAAAGPGSFDDATLNSIAEVIDEPDTGPVTDSTTTTTTTSEVPADPAPTTTAAPAALASTDASTSTSVDPAGGEDEPVDDPDTAFDERQCAEGNHGKTVSSVARTPGRTSDDVRDAAHSSCGKKDKDGGDEKDDDADDDADEGDDADDGSGDDRDRGHGNGHNLETGGKDDGGKDNGGKGKGKGGNSKEAKGGGNGKGSSGTP